MSKGIDVSRHQGAVDWKKVKAAGIEFAVIRAGYGMYANQADTEFAANMQGAKSAGVPVGVYWYSYAVTEAEAKREAETCLKIIEPYRGQIALPVFFDQEYEPGIKAQTKETRTKLCLAFLEAVRQAGYRPGLYCSYDWYQNWVDSSRLSAYPVWIAQYASRCSYAGQNLVAWQYTGKGTVNGVTSLVDLDEGYAGLFLKTGWVWENSGWYWYENGAPVKNRWLKDGGWWYRLGPEGKMLTGLQNVGGKAYLLNPQGQSAAGGYLPTGACIITDSSGAVLFP